VLRNSVRRVTAGLVSMGAPNCSDSSQFSLPM
jgi:hypothetical protein